MPVNRLLDDSISCPYCGETLDILIDLTDLDQQYIEDCQVCCRPINFLLTEGIDRQYIINVYTDDDAI